MRSPTLFKQRSSGTVVIVEVKSRDQNFKTSGSKHPYLVFFLSISQFIETMSRNQFFKNHGRSKKALITRTNTRDNNMFKAILNIQ
jgi:hypothetical protein